MYKTATVLVVFFITALLTMHEARASIQGDSREPATPMEVTGQSRNLNMMLVLRNDKDKIKFVKVRENYRDEITAENAESSESVENSGGAIAVKDAKAANVMNYKEQE